MREELAESLNEKKAERTSRPATTECPICRDGHTIDWASIARYRYLRCGTCGLVYLERTPGLNELRQFYNTSFEVDRDSQAKKVGRQSLPLLVLLEKVLPDKGKLLEIGCSYGHFLNRAEQAGWQVEGVEISRMATDWARRTFRMHVHAGTLEDVLPALSAPYDVVVMLHVLEHDPEPQALLRRVRQLLRPKGFLVVRTPNVASWIARFCGPTWEWLMPPAHLALFSPASLQLLLQRTGFQAELVKTQRGDAHNTLFEIARSVAKRLQNSKPHTSGVAITPPSRTRWYHSTETAFDLLYRPFEPLENLYFRQRLLNPELLVLARRSD